MKAPKKPRVRNYINNREMHDRLVEYLELCDKAEESGAQLPIVPDYLGKCFLQIATRLSSKPNFSGYSYVEEMRSEGVLTCLKYIRNYNPEKSNNPFAYFTQFIKNSFRQQINTEHRSTYLKYKNYQQLQSLEMLGGGTSASAPELYDNYNAFIENFERKAAVKKAEKAKKKAEALTFDDDKPQETI